MVPGEKFSTTTSAHSMSGSSTSRLAGCFMSSERLELRGVEVREPGLVVEVVGARGTRPARPAARGRGAMRDSTLMISQPRSPSVLVVIEPTSAQEKSSTRTPASGPRLMAMDGGAGVLRSPASVPAFTVDGNESLRRLRRRRRFARNRAPPDADPRSTSAGAATTVALMPRRRPSLAISARVRVRKNASIAPSHRARVAGSSVERL